MPTYRIYVNSGHLAVDNGAKNAIRNMFDIAKIADGYHGSDGAHWGSDYIEVEEDKLDIVIELLIESKIPYKINHHPEHVDTWKGLVTEEALRVCRAGADYKPTYQKLHFKLNT